MTEALDALPGFSMARNFLAWDLLGRGLVFKRCKCKTLFDPELFVHRFMRKRKAAYAGIWKITRYLLEAPNVSFVSLFSFYGECDGGQRKHGRECFALPW
jgi:hypothetical protein